MKNRVIRKYIPSVPPLRHVTALNQPSPPRNRGPTMSVRREFRMLQFEVMFAENCVLVWALL